MGTKLPDYLLGLTFKKDGRMRRPDEAQKRARLVAFRKGWSAALSGKAYKRKTLRSLKWVNYGYRLGMLEGAADPEVQERIFNALYDNQQHKLDEAPTEEPAT